MVQNKKMVDELKKYNFALEKHFTNLDFDSISNLSQSSVSSSDKDEFYSLVATSILDTKTEMALMRKNLSVEIEGMTRRMIQDEQNMFIEQMNKFYGKIIFELKENLNSHVREINSDVAELKRDISEISSRNKDFSKDLQSFGQEITDFKQALNSLEELSLRNNNQKELVLKLSSFENKFDTLLNEISKKNGFIESNAMLINKKLAQIEKRVLETDEIMLNEKTLLEKELNQNKISFDNVDSKFRQIENFLFKLESVAKNQDKKLNKFQTRELGSEELLLNQNSKLENMSKQNKNSFSDIEKNLRTINNSNFKLQEKSDKSKINLKNKLEKNENSIQKVKVEKKEKEEIINKEKVVLSKQKELKNKVMIQKEDEFEVKQQVLSKPNFKEELKLDIEEKKSQKMESKIEKILEINKRLEKLESLRE